jgi:uncharacterized membrane protein YccC
MAGESVSFRITRTTEDLAQTVAALSQRLVKLEQRFAAVELQLDRLVAEPEPDQEELRRLDQVASLLADCRSLLEDPEDSDQRPHPAMDSFPVQTDDESLAA